METFFKYVLIWLSRYRLFIGCSLALLLFVILSCFGFWIFVSWNDYFRPGLAAVHAAGRLNEIAGYLGESAADPLIESAAPESGIGGGSTIYASASMYQVYEANRPLEATAALYTTFFEEMGWHYTIHSRSDFQPMFYQYNDGTWMAVFSEESTTAYRITLIFSEACECSFEPMTPPALADNRAGS